MDDASHHGRKRAHAIVPTHLGKRALQLSVPIVSCKGVFPQDFCGAVPLRGEPLILSLITMARAVREAADPCGIRLIQTARACMTEAIRSG